MERVTVALDAPYDVVVGAGALGEVGRAARRAPPGRGREPARCRRLARAGADRRAPAGGRQHRPVPHGRRRGREVARHRRRPVPALRAPGVCSAATRSSRSVAVWWATPPASPPRSTTAASRSCRPRPRCSRRSTPPSAARPRSTCPRARTWSARSTSRSAVLADVEHARDAARRGSTAPGSARSRSTRSCPAASASRTLVARARRRGASRATPTSSTDLVAACAAIKADVVAVDPEERTGLRATLNYGHTLGARARDRSAATSCSTVRRSRSGSSSRARSRVRSSGSTPTPSTHHRDVVAALGLPDRGARSRADPRRRCSRRCAATRRRRRAHVRAARARWARDGRRPRRARVDVAFRAVGVSAGVGG